jgi:hypothetical protein
LVFDAGGAKGGEASFGNSDDFNLAEMPLKLAAIHHKSDCTKLAQMDAVYLGKSRGGEWAAASAALAILALAAIIFWGPYWVYGFSGAGLIAGVTAAVLGSRSESIEKPIIFPLLISSSHVVLLAIATLLHVMFLSALNPSLRKVPLLQELYEDPSAMFRFKGPVGWTYRPLPSSIESGVRIRPADQSMYMGISEITIFVRRLEKPPASPEAFLKTASEQFSQRREKQKLFSLTSESGRSLGGAPVLFSELILKRFWVSLNQTSVFGVKNARYLCSVSATGLQSHSSLSRLLCLGLLERIEITDKAGT